MMSHPLKPEKNGYAYKCPKNCTKVSKFNQRQFANSVTGIEAWMYNFESVRKFGSKLRLSKHSGRPVVTKRTMSENKDRYAIFFSCDDIAV